MSERSLWKTVDRHLGPLGHLERVENRAGINVGCPDISFCINGATGWLELKHLPAWPIRPETPVVIRRLTLDQVRWAERHVAAGGRYGLLLLVTGPTYAMFDAEGVRALYERQLYRSLLEQRAKVFLKGRFPAVSVKKYLTETRTDKV